MALRFASVLLCTIFVIGLGLAAPPRPPSGKCGENAERRACGSACAPRCNNPNPGPICVLPCVDDCFCKEGYLKAANGACVRPQECDAGHPIAQQIPQLNAAVAGVPQLDDEPKCGDNEVHTQCAPSCARTCAMPIPKPWCSLRCFPGCVCKDGYLKNEEGVCIPAPRCLELSAVAPPQGPVNIPLHKVPLKPQGPVNIPLHKAPLKPHCPSEKEEFHNCGVQLNCLASCKMPSTPKCMERQCTPGCMCREPFVRHEDGRCVEKTQCPETTPF